MDFIGLSDAQKIGLMLVAVAVLFGTVGVLLFFDRALLIIANMTLLAGLGFLSGLVATLRFFSPVPLDLRFTASWFHKFRATGTFWVGVLLLLYGWTMIGFVIELVGLALMFARFGRPAVRLLHTIPGASTVLGLPGISHVISVIDDTPLERRTL